MFQIWKCITDPEARGLTKGWPVQGLPAEAHEVTIPHTINVEEGLVQLLQECSPRFCQMNAVVLPDQKFHADLFLQPLDAAAQGRLGDIQCLRRQGNAVVLCYRPEILKLL